MDEPMYSEPFAASTRDGQTWLTSAPFGPAGSSTVELPDGTVWEVDHLDPARLVSLLVESELDDSQLVRDLLGPERFDRLCAAIDEARSVRKPGKRLNASVEGDTLWGAVSQPRSQPRWSLARAIGESVVAADMANDDSLPALVRLAAGLEFLSRVRDGQPEQLLGGVSDDMVATVYNVALEVVPDDFDEIGPGAGKVLLRFRSLLQWGQSEVATLDLPLRHVDELFRQAERNAGDGRRRRAAGDEHDGLYPLSLESEVFNSPLGNVDFALASFDQPLGGDLAGLQPQDFLEVEMPEPGQLRVQVSRQHEGKWVRVLKASGLVPLALAPLTVDGMLLEAVVVVPPELGPADLVVTVEDPDHLVGPERPLGLVRGAIEAGRAAARYERLERFGDADLTWTECSRLWAQVGDETRATLAADRRSDRYGRRWGSAGRALVADEVYAAIAEDVG